MTQSPKDLTHLLSAEAKSRKNSPLKECFVYFGQPGLTFLGGGLPLADYFPYNKISAEIPTPGFEGGIGAPITEANKTEIEVYRLKENNGPNQIELARSLQYGYTEGHKEIVDFLKEHTKMIHKPVYDEWDLICTVGNTEAWDSTLRTFTSRGDTIFVEEYTFSSALETVNALGVHTFPVPIDEHGLIPEKFATILETWEGPIPRLLYTIPTGQNPTGSSASLERRKAIYELACKYDFLIVEDEPYYFLQMEKYTTDLEARKARHVHSHEEFIKALVPSYISIDAEGRVLRLDSFSKVIAPGSRFGWIVGQKKLLERFLRLHEVSIQCPSGFSQSLLNGLLQSWGQTGYLDWLIGLRAEYTHKRDVAIDSIHKYFPQEVVTYDPPVAGMFFTVSIDTTKHPKFATDHNSDPAKVEEAIFQQAIKQGCLMIPGSYFKVTPPPDHKLTVVDAGSANQIFFRGTYAAVPLDALQVGLENFGKALRVEFGLN
ncbi:uncharacterized protein KQ657_004721 [Scheffersomyces spartinae]|uniref:aromatic-amino-acid transaminase n=1 Tax=Scheffersomyces spartinae TaxID=45513 RepID=A0A9P8AJ87_9ASCO|nr:uncharacterized protein KQ657_004721 [Scheffersomyces spartinae]KAG7194506.1 hypothetical protein KQ657_004721 [Scheffersomyces spartinae]